MTGSIFWTLDMQGHLGNYRLQSIIRRFSSYLHRGALLPSRAALHAIHQKADGDVEKSRSGQRRSP